MPWSPTDGTDEPVLAAGIGLLGVAWLLRGIRRRGETNDRLTASDPTVSDTTASDPTPTPDGGSA